MTRLKYNEISLNQPVNILPDIMANVLWLFWHLKLGLTIACAILINTKFAGSDVDPDHFGLSNPNSKKKKANMRGTR